jgi:hypothetical protein
MYEERILRVIVRARNGIVVPGITVRMECRTVDGVGPVMQVVSDAAGQATFNHLQTVVPDGVSSGRRYYVRDATVGNREFGLPVDPRNPPREPVVLVLADTGAMQVKVMCGAEPCSSPVNVIIGSWDAIAECMNDDAETMRLASGESEVIAKRVVVGVPLQVMLQVQGLTLSRLPTSTVASLGVVARTTIDMSRHAAVVACVVETEGGVPIARHSIRAVLWGEGRNMELRSDTNAVGRCHVLLPENGIGMFIEKITWQVVAEGNGDVRGVAETGVQRVMRVGVLEMGRIVLR